MTPPYSEATVEAAARAGFESERARVFGPGCGPSWDEVDEVHRVWARDSARAVVGALAAAGRLLPEGAAEPLPMRWFDEIVSTDVRLNGYAYGGGTDGTGIQITLDDSNRILAARLPWADARAFALTILAAIGPVPPEPKEGTDA